MMYYEIIMMGRLQHMPKGDARKRSPVKGMVSGPPSARAEEPVA